MAASLRYAKHGDVVITDVGETVEDVVKQWHGLGMTISLFMITVMLFDIL